MGSCSRWSWPAPESFRGCDLVLGAAEAEIARRFVGDIQKAGAVFVDNSSAFRLDSRVPLVVPEVNPEDVRHHLGILANPNCTTAITLTALAPLHRRSPVQSLVVSTYQAVSGAGSGGIDEMEAQLAGSEECAVFPYPIARNVIPCIGAPVAEGYTQEEMKLQNEGRKILHRPGLTVSCTCVRIPVVRCHSISVTARFLRPVDPEEARQAIEQAAGCRLVDDIALGNYPMPLTAGDPGSGGGGAHPAGSDRRQRPELLVLRRSAAQGRSHQCGANCRIIVLTKGRVCARMKSITDSSQPSCR